MMTGPVLVAQATLMLVSLVQGSHIFHHPVVFHPTYYHTAGNQIFIRNDDAQLPCPGEAFFVNPRNCSRFYRCVDYTGTGALFSRYHFECPKSHVFITEAQTCLPGFCPNSPQAVVAPPTQAPASSTESTSTEAPAVTSTDASTVFPTEAPSVTSTDASSVFPTEAAIVTTLAPSSSTQPPPSAEEPCPDRYVQHPDFCNVYTPCHQSSVRYVCPGGTAFDQSRQMCRISAINDGLCTGKELFKHPFLLRTENIGAHVRLPDYIHVPTSRPVNTGTFGGVQVVSLGQPSISVAHPSISKPTFPTASPLQLYLWPTAKPSRPGVDASIPNFGIERNVYRPLFNRPAQVYRRPDEPSPAAETYDSTFQMLRPVGIETSPPASTKFRPLAHVRRPEGHLHFRYIPTEVFGYQREVV